MERLAMKYLKHYLFALVVIAIIVSNIFTIPTLLKLDWSNIQAFIEVLRLILFWVVGLEVARLLLEYRTEVVVELLVFVVARKLLLLEHDFFSLFIGVAAVIALLYLRFVMRTSHEHHVPAGHKTAS